MLQYVSQNQKTLCLVSALLCILLSGCCSRENTPMNADAAPCANVTSEYVNALNASSETEAQEGTKLADIQEKVSAQVSTGEQRDHLLEHIDAYKNVKDAVESGDNVPDIEDANLADLYEEILTKTNRNEERNRSLELIQEYKKEVG